MNVPAKFILCLQSVCNHLSIANISDIELLQHLGDALDVYYNSTGTVPCFNTSTTAVASLEEKGWDFQVLQQYINLTL